MPRQRPGKTAKPAADPRPRSAPSRYIVRVDAKTGKEIPGEIDARELLVHAHRDNHPVEVAAQFVASRLIRLTGREATVRKGLRLINSVGAKLARGIGSVSGNQAAGAYAKQLMGVVDRDHAFKFREPTHHSEKDVRARIEKLQREAKTLLAARGRHPKLHVLLTGATGFLGKEILQQVSEDSRVALLTSVVRPETIRDPKTKEVVKVLSPAERGRLLLKRLGIAGSRAKKFEFVKGDIEQVDLGLGDADRARLRRCLTHVIHCAASVAFDDPYETSWNANVLGCRNALAFSLSCQAAEGSSFSHHIAIETSYIHGRRKSSIAQESALVFPRHFYNNYYELTKAMASIETDQAMIEKGLRVVQILPSIVIGHSRTGNNRGDTKVVNAPVNAFGRAKEAAETGDHDLVARARAWLVAAVANGFPGDPSAELNLVPVDRVVAGILASLVSPEAIGHRVHLATDNRIAAGQVVETCRKELGVNVRLVDPTLYRNVTLPLVKGALEAMKEPKLANALEKLGTIFGAYNEWGQPVHEVGNDVRILGLPIQRPDTLHAFRMLCRHNRFVQEYGKVRDPDEVARRETLWQEVIEAIEFKTGRQAAALRASEFRKRLAEELDLGSFRRRAAAGEAGVSSRSPGASR